MIPAQDSLSTAIALEHIRTQVGFEAGIIGREALAEITCQIVGERAVTVHIWQARTVGEVKFELPGTVLFGLCAL
jgi:hypothetical protein